MQYYWRIWLWENGAKSTEYTDYMVLPFFYEACLNQTINTGEIILDSMPIATKKAFPPKSKFVVERYTTADYSDEPKSYDFVVNVDNVEEYVGSPEICCHRMDMIMPSVVAQGMHVDNISLTYELQDATLNYSTTVNDSSVVAVNTLIGGHQQPLRQSDDFAFPTVGGSPTLV